MKTLLFIPFLFVYSIVISQTYNSNSIIGKPKKIGNLEIAQNDFPDEMNWEKAKIACEKLGKGWRLPTKKELEIMCKNRHKIGGFASLYYWSSTEDDSSSAWGQGFYEVYQGSGSKDDYYGVRAVRAF